MNMIVDVRLSIFERIVCLVAYLRLNVIPALLRTRLSLSKTIELARSLVLANRCDCSLKRVRIYHVNRRLLSLEGVLLPWVVKELIVLRLIELLLSIAVTKYVDASCIS